LESFRFLGSIITQDLKWELNISSITKKAQQRMNFLQQLKKFSLPKTMMVHFYTAIIEFILTFSITIWYAVATAKDKGRLQHVISSAGNVIDCNLTWTPPGPCGEQVRLWSTPPTPDINFLSLSPPAGGCGPSGPKSHATRTTFSPRQLASLTRPGTPTDPHPL